MHIVHIEDFIHPDAGYQVNLLARLQVLQGHSVTIVTAEMEKIPDYLTGFFGKQEILARDERFFSETGARIVRLPILGWVSGRALYRPGMFKLINELNPDVLFVHGESTLTGMLFIWRRIWNSTPMILDSHMLEMASVNPFRQVFQWFYRAAVAPVVRWKSIPLVRVVDSDYVQACLGIPLSQTRLLSFGTDTAYFSPDESVRHNFREQNSIGDQDFVVLYAGKLDRHKGGLFLAEAIKNKFELPSGRRIVFVVVGNCVGEYGCRVESEFSGCENFIIRFPTQRYLDLSKFYQAADVAVYPAQCSMSFFEAQACGLPVLFENNEINAARAEHGNALLFESGDVTGFRDRIGELASLPLTEYKKMSVAAREFVYANYDFVPIAGEFTELLQQQLDEK